MNSKVLKTKIKIFGNMFGYIENLYLKKDGFYSNGDNIRQVIAQCDTRNYDSNNIKKLKTISNHIEGISLFILETKATSYGYIYHYFHFTEHLIALLSTILYFKLSPLDVKYVWVIGGAGKKNKKWKGPHKINAKLIKGCFPNAKVINAIQFNRLRKKGTIKIEKAVISDRANFKCILPKIKKINKHLAWAENDIKIDYVKKIRDLMIDFFRIKDEKRKKTITYILRKKRKRLEPKLRKKLLKSLKLRYPDWKVKAVNFAGLSFQRQIETAYKTDVLIGAHGNGLTHALMLPDKGKVIEFSPANSNHFDYRLLSKLRGLRYLCYNEELGVVSEKKAYKLGAYGEPHSIIKKIDFNAIFSFIDS